MKPMLDGNLMFPTQYLAWEELKGKAWTLTIKGVFFDDLRMKTGGKERKPVLTFVETPKKLVMCTTRGQHAAEALDEIEGRKWVGRKITIFPGRWQNGTNMIDIETKTNKFSGKRASSGAVPPTSEDAPRGAGADTPASILTKIYAQKDVSADDFEAACIASGLPVEDTESDAISGLVMLGDYKGAVKMLISKLAEVS